MSAGLIKHLRKKTDEDSNTRILMSQWEFDEKLVGKSLENVGSYYPHFSSHNESHSQQILVNIERLLGSNIEKLTATDTWLILEAAYWHDIGMLFNADEVQKVFEEDDFKEYVESLANDNTQDLHEFAKVWHEDGWNKALVNHSDPHTGVEKYRQMIAEWYRRGHAKNSNSVVLDPFEKLGISSPRTELLPKRIYRYLGQICWAHGLGFEDYVMKTLPFRQTGMGTENCHPRFVACLLRLGDLFDIDDNRFCPVMARQVGNMPSFSETHRHKHQAIREFQLDNETVSITAVCSTEMAYIECRNWFDWIKEEIQNQMSQWKNIVPSRDFGLLPTINKLDVKMTGKKILLDYKPMKFSLDERSAIELLQGNNLYEDDMSIYRELIQNAIDATMIRVWLEHGKESSQEVLPFNSNPYDEDTRKLFEKFPITIDFKKVIDNKDLKLWEFSVEDNGIGISLKDLEYMQKIAGSKNNKEKRRIIREMPQWMRPSGEFGIGLHSAFLLMRNLPSEQQKIIIFTKSRITNESLKIELNSPLSDKAGYCFIEKIDDIGRYGTRLIIKTVFNEEKYLQRASHISSWVKDYKFDNSVVLDHLLSINEFIIHNSPFKIQFTSRISSLLDTAFTMFDNLTTYSLNVEANYNNSKAYWNEEYQFALSIFIPKNLSEHTYGFSDNIIMYKGQSVGNYEISENQDYPFYRDLFLGYHYKLDIYDSTSGKYLKISRDEWNYDYLRNKLKLFSDAFLKENLSGISSTALAFNKDKTKHALFSYSYEPNDSLISSIKEYKINETDSIDDLLKFESFQLVINIEDFKNTNSPHWVNCFECKINYPTYLVETVFSIFKNEGYNIYYYKEEFGSRMKLNLKQRKSVYFSRIEQTGEFQHFEFNKDNLKLSNEMSNLDSVFYYLIPSLHPMDRRTYLAHGSLTSMPSLDLGNYSGFQDINIQGKVYIPFVRIDDLIVKTEIDNYVRFIIDHKPEYNEVSIREQYEKLVELVLNHASKHKDYERWKDAYVRGEIFKPLNLSSLDELYKLTL